MTVARVALITGANRGIGLEISRQLAAKGLTVVLGARDGAKGKAAAASLDNAKASSVVLDVADGASVTKAVEETIARHGRIDVLVNNAGVMLDRGNPPVTGVLAIPPALLADTLAVNLTGPLRVIQAVLPHMQKAGYGRIVNLSSRMGSLGEMQAGVPMYRISKTALNALTRVAAAELGSGPIKINAMHPGWIKTDMGGPSAPGNVIDAADTAVWLATLADDGPTGGFFFERKPLAW